MSKNYLDYEEFDRSSAVSTGGVTGSERVKRNGIFYQLKYSIKDAKLVRNIKAGGLERENFGEVIASSVGRALTNSNKDLELVPEVSLVYDKKNKKVLIASRYLNNVEGELSQYKVEQTPDNSSFIKLPKGSKDDKALDLSSENNQELKKDLALAIAISALSGDHDVNRGNMLVTKDNKGKERIARIDFGHAFNDLLGAPKAFGGKIRNKNNFILDFINRKEVSHLISKEDRESKLWRNYKDLVPSRELAEAFKEIANSNKLQTGLSQAKDSFQSLVNELQKNPNENKEVLNHIKNTLIAINNTISKNKLKPGKISVQEALDKTFTNIENFYTKGQQQMKDVANLMDVQLKIDQLIVDKKAGKIIDQSLIKEIKENYLSLQEIKGIAQKDAGIEWIKTNKENPAFKGQLNPFVEKRASELGINATGIEDLTKEFAKSPIKNNIIIKTADNVNNEYELVAKFLEESVNIYAHHKSEKQLGLTTEKTFKKLFKDDLHQTLNKLESQVADKNLDSNIISALRENVNNYAEKMNKEMTRAKNNLLNKNISEAKNLSQNDVLLQACANNNFIKTSQALKTDQKSWVSKVGKDTSWKKAAEFFNSIKVKPLAKFCEHKNELAKQQNINKKLGFTNKIINRMEKNKNKGFTR